MLLEPAGLLAFLADSRHQAPQRLVLPVRVDQILEGYFGDLSGVGAGLLLSRQQKYVPIFQPGDKISLAFNAGGEPLDLEMVVVDVEESGQVVRIGGFFVNLPAAQQALVYKLKNALEARLHGEAGGR